MNSNSEEAKRYIKKQKINKIKIILAQTTILLGFLFLWEILSKHEIINSFLASLPTQSRKFFVGRYFYARSIKEIARMYGVSENKVIVSLFRTREKLRKALTKEGIDI